MHRVLAVSLAFAFSALPLAAASLTINPTGTQRVEGNTKLKAVLTVDTPSLVTTQIALSSSNPAAATVPASVTLNAKAVSATFSIAIGNPSSDTPVTIFMADPKATVDFTVLAAPAVSIGVEPQLVVSGSQGKAVVKLSRPAGYPGVSVKLSSGDTSAATVPATAMIPAGQAMAVVPVATKLVARDVELKLNASYGAATESALLTVRPAPLELASVTVPTPIVTGQSPPMATIRLNRAATDATNTKGQACGSSGGRLVCNAFGNGLVCSSP